VRDAVARSRRNARYAGIVARRGMRDIPGACHRNVAAADVDKVCRLWREDAAPVNAVRERIAPIRSGRGLSTVILVELRVVTIADGHEADVADHRIDRKSVV